MCLAFWAASVHCWLMYSFSTTGEQRTLLHRADLPEFFFQSVPTSGIALTQMQHLALVEPRGVLMGPLLQFLQVPLDGIPSLSCVNCTTQI